MKLKHIMLAITVGLWAQVWRQAREKANQMPIKNKVVIITGASSGIGWATAHAFANAGAHVILVARRANLLAALQEELTRKGHHAITIAGDITSEADMQTVIDETMREFGRIDILVNNAGVAVAGLLETIAVDSVQKMVDINLYSAIRLTQLVVPIMKAQKSGHIINISSTAGLTHSPAQTVYSATKSGLLGFTKGLRRELNPYNVFVSSLHPGWTDTDMLSDEKEQIINPDGILIRILTPEEVADAAIEIVRYQRDIMIIGGIGFYLMWWLERFAPQLAEKYYEQNRERFINLMKVLT